MEPSHAFMAAIAGEHFSFIARYLARLGVRAQDIEDVAQEVLAGAYRALPRFDASRGSVRSWLMGIATHQASNHFRRAHRRRERLRSLDDLAELPDATPDSEQRVIARDRRGVLDQLLAELPMERRCVFVAHELEEIDMAEIAQQLSIPLSTAWSRHRLAWVDIEAAMRRWQARQRGRALAFIPVSAGALVREARADREIGRSLLARVGRALSPRRLAGASASRSAALHAVATAAAPLAAAAAVAIAIGALRADASLVAADARASTAPAVAAVAAPEAQAPTPQAHAASPTLAAVAAPQAQAAAPPSPAGAAPPSSPGAAPPSPAGAAPPSHAAATADASRDRGSAVAPGAAAGISPAGGATLPGRKAALRPAAGAAAPAGRRAAASNDEEIAAERALIDGAITALSKGRYAEANSRLAEHRRRFPAGRLTAERNAALRALRARATAAPLPSALHDVGQASMN
ncbi:RNA polymerase sigma factor [Sorangium sp. So ce185]|uniref:RNA polymerase sigma factor n=1 Tax=Sorangium sp. So ce185 TaxID=3133287 RepID=UPI003F5EBE90